MILKLTDQQRRILTATAEGHTDEHIANALGIQTGAVRVHLSMACTANKAINRAHLTAMAFRAGILK